MVERIRKTATPSAEPQKKIQSSEVPEVTISDNSAQERLYKFVEEQIERMKKYTFLGNGAPQFWELNEALCNYSTMNCSLISLDVMAKEEYQEAKNAFDEFVAEKYTIIRKENNLQSIAAQKWLSTQEIMYLVQSDSRWIFEYRALRDEVNAAEKKVAFCRRLLDNMSTYSIILNRLCKNVEVETQSLNLPVNQ